MKRERINIQEDELLKNVADMAVSMRADALMMGYSAGAKAVHFGGGVSSIDILAVLYGAVMDIDPEHPEWEERDRFILSKGHGVLGYYAALHECGYISKEELCSIEKDGSFLLGHPIKNVKKGIEYSTGSLGQGISIGVGVALSLKKQSKNSKVYVLMGDGECNEGSVWEAFMSAAQYQLDNIVAIIDRNHFQLGGNTENIMDIGNAAAKLQSFGWETREVDGHDVEQLYHAFTKDIPSGKPLAIIADTIKGYGFSFSASNNDWHHAVVTKELYESGMQELGRKPETEYIENQLRLWDEKEFEVMDEDSVKNCVETEPFLLSKQIIRRWSLLGQRVAFGLAALDEAQKNDKIMVLTADVSTSAGLERYIKSLPEQFLDIGIAEQNMMGIATGLSSMGYTVITCTFAPFQSMRCLEQIRVNLGYMKNKVIMVGLASGLSLGTLGNTHCCFEDVGVLRSIPNIAVISPADAGEVGKAIHAALSYPDSVYIRLTGGGGCPVVYQEDYEFEIGRAIVVKEAAHIEDCVTIIATGTMVHVAGKAAEILREKNIETEVLNMHTIKPIDRERIRKSSEYAGLMVTVEEHSVCGGLGTAVAEVLAEAPDTPELLVLGLPDAYGHGGEYQNLLEKYGLTASQIAEEIYNHYSRKGED